MAQTKAKDTCCKVWQPKFDTKNPPGRRELTLKSLSSDPDICDMECMHT